MHSLDHMLNADSVAIVGASQRQGSVGNTALRQIVDGQYAGRVYPVNPRYDVIDGLPCYETLLDMGEQVDLVILAVANTHLEAEMERVAEAGAKSAVIFASCHGDAADGSRLRDRLRDIADQAGVRICGGNGMGFVNLDHGLRATGYFQPVPLMPGGTTFLSHSGSLFSAMLHNGRDLRFNLVVSSGLELNTGMADYLEWALEQQSTNTVALFLETIRQPERFRAALIRAHEMGVPVVALKVGVSEMGRRAVATHSQAIAGDDGVFEALFEAAGVHRVASMDEMMDTVELLAAGFTPSTPGLGAVLDSGGERALLVDTAARSGVDIPSLAEESSRRLAAILDPALEPQNPIDAWGTGHGAGDLVAECARILDDDESIGLIALCFDLTHEDLPEDEYVEPALTASRELATPILVMGNLTSTLDKDQTRRLREGGVPVLEGTETGLRAIRHLFDRMGRDEDEASRLVASSPLPSVTGEVSRLAALAAYGIRVPSARRADREDLLLAAAGEIGYPVVLKTANADHKTDVGGVLMGLVDPGGLAAAYRDISNRLGPEVVVAQQVDGGVEIGLGMVVDESFGPVVVVSAGGTLIEVVRDRVTLMPPVSPARALRALHRLAMWDILEGTRGRAPVDVAAMVDVIARFSELAMDGAEAYASIDINPVIVNESGAYAVDALFIRKD